MQEGILDADDGPYAPSEADVTMTEISHEVEMKDGECSPLAVKIS